jgi:tRNA(fMet)-specific endonuclease VapC
MLYILDTDHVSLVQRGNTHVRANLAQISSVDQRAVTIITVIEQLQGRLAVIHQARSEVEVARGGERLQETLAFYASIHVLPYDTDAQVQFAHLRRRRVRIGTQDWRIAAIALRWHATVVTRNSRDFGQVPGLNIVDWSIA